MKRFGVIYKITNTITGKEYVGQTTGSISERFAAHASEKRNRHISSTIRKYGKQNFHIEEMATAFDLDSLNKLEVYFLEMYNTMYPNGYNHRVGGEQCGYCSELTKQKISKSKQGKPNLKLKNREITNAQRLAISATLGGQEILAISLKDNSMLIFPTAHSTRAFGHNPSNVVQICKKSSGRTISKGYKFYYLNDYVNQSGSSKSNILEHAQRIEIETAKRGI
jgi:group I intron endonuclease